MTGDKRLLAADKRPMAAVNGWRIASVGFSTSGWGQCIRMLPMLLADLRDTLTKQRSGEMTWADLLASADDIYERKLLGRRT